MSKAIQAYHRLPAVARHIVASLHGYGLRRWRYGSETEALVREARERETWDAARWREWQQSKLADVLKRACSLVPGYREKWQHRRSAGDSSSPLVLSNWPVLSKEELRQNPGAFLAEGISNKRLRVEHTSGTTGTP